MANVNFTLRSPNAKELQPIYLTYRFGRNEKLIYPTGLKVTPKHWNFETQRVRNITEVLKKDDINSLLNELKTVTESYIIELKTNKKKITKTILKKFIDNYLNPRPVNENTLLGFIVRFIEESQSRINPKNGGLIARKTIQKYNTTLKYLEAFAKNTRREIDFNSIDLEFYHAFIEYLQRPQPRKQSRNPSKNKPSSVRRDRSETPAGLSTNTIGKYINTLKVFLNEATERGLNKNYAYKSNRFKGLSEDSESVYITENELKQLFEFDFSDNPKLERVRDLFLLGAWTGLRFSDFTKLTADNLKGEFIEIRQEKTGGRVIIPLHPVFVAIWNKYNYQLPRNISNQKFNDYIKDACELAKINSVVNKAITKGGVREAEKFEKWELVSSHTARRSFATNLFKGGFPAISIMQITGHRTEKAFMKYIKVTPDEHAKLLQTHWIKEGKHLRAI